MVVFCKEVGCVWRAFLWSKWFLVVSLVRMLVRTVSKLDLQPISEKIELMHFFPLFFDLIRGVWIFSYFFLLKLFPPPHTAMEELLFNIQTSNLQIPYGFAFFLPEACDYIAFCYYIFSRVEISSVMMDHSLYIYKTKILNWQLGHFNQMTCCEGAVRCSKQKVVQTLRLLWWVSPASSH